MKLTDIVNFYRRFRYKTPVKANMPFVENGGAIKPLLEELQARNVYADDITKILALYRQYYEAAERVIRENPTRGKAGCLKGKTK